MESTVNENPGEEYHLSISKEELAKLQPAHFKGVIHVIDKEEDVAGAIQVLRSSSVIGFDTETRPSFKKGLTHIVSLLQLSTREDAFLFRLNKIGMPKALKDLIEDENALKVGSPFTMIFIISVDFVKLLRRDLLIFRNMCKSGIYRIFH